MLNRGNRSFALLQEVENQRKEHEKENADVSEST